MNIAVPINRSSVEDLLVGAEQKEAKAKSDAADRFSGSALLLSRTDPDAHMN